MCRSAKAASKGQDRGRSDNRDRGRDRNRNRSYSNGSRSRRYSRDRYPSKSRSRSRDRSKSYKYRHSAHSAEIGTTCSLLNALSTRDTVNDTIFGKTLNIDAVTVSRRRLEECPVLTGPPHPPREKTISADYVATGSAPPLGSLKTDAAPDGQDTFNKEIRLKYCGSKKTKKMMVKIDSGASACMMPLSKFRKLFPETIDSDGKLKSSALAPTEYTWVGHDSNVNRFLGTATVDVQMAQRQKFLPTRFYVFEDKNNPPILLSYSASTQLGYMKPTAVNDARKMPASPVDAVMQQLAVQAVLQAMEEQDVQPGTVNPSNLEKILESADKKFLDAADGIKHKSAQKRGKGVLTGPPHPHDEVLSSGTRGEQDGVAAAETGSLQDHHINLQEHTADERSSTGKTVLTGPPHQFASERLTVHGRLRRQLEIDHMCTRVDDTGPFKTKREQLQEQEVERKLRQLMEKVVRERPNRQPEDDATDVQPDPEKQKQEQTPFPSEEKVREIARDIISLKEQYPDTFDTIGNMKGKYTIRLRENSRPVMHARRKIAIHLKAQIEAQILALLEMGVIVPVIEPTEWVSSLTYPKKQDGSIRVCLDPKDINKCIIREIYKAPTLDEITYKMKGAKFFSKLDAKNGFWAIHLDEQSSYLTTFNTHMGRFRFTRVPFGLTMSPDIFQQRMDEITSGLKGIIAIHDDICVFGKTREEHDENLVALLRRATDQGLVFNSKKCSIRQDRIGFYGAYWDAQGRHPDPVKIQAIRDMPPPRSEKELQTFLGMTNFLSPHVPCMSDKSHFLRQHASKQSWNWLPDDDIEFEKFKEWLCSYLQTSVLGYYDPKEDVVIQTDASEYGLGAVILQKGKPIAFASKSLTDTESRYANIEREMLAVCFGLEKFHTYVYGRPVTVESDHKPLETIKTKHIYSAPPRLQRMLLRNQRYDYRITYRPGKEMILADGLSRFPSRKERQEMEFEKSIDSIDLQLPVDHVHFTDARIELIKETTRRDPILSTIYRLTQQGWPDRQRHVPEVARHAWTFRDELSIDDGLVMKGERVYIPEDLRDRTLAELHAGHVSYEKMQQNAKTTVYWKGIDADCKDYAQRCPICIQHAAARTKSPMRVRDVPDGPWIEIAADFFHQNGNTYLLIADTFSKFPFMFKMQTTTATAVINRFEEIFSHYRVPRSLLTDNGSPFNSNEFRQYLHRRGIYHITSSPMYPQSNGFIERYVKKMKEWLIKSKQQNYTIPQVLEVVRNLPIGRNQPTPCEILHNRVTGRPGQPAHPIDMEAVRNYLIESKILQKQQYDRRHRTVQKRRLSRGEEVMYLTPAGTFEQGTIESKHPDFPRSYYVTSAAGRFRRTRDQIRELDPRSILLRQESSFNSKTVLTGPPHPPKENSDNDSNRDDEQPQKKSKKHKNKDKDSKDSKTKTTIKKQLKFEENGKPVLTGPPHHSASEPDTGMYRQPYVPPSTTAAIVQPYGPPLPEIEDIFHHRFHLWSSDSEPDSETDSTTTSSTSSTESSSGSTTGTGSTTSSTDSTSGTDSTTTSTDSTTTTTTESDSDSSAEARKSRSRTRRYHRKRSNTHTGSSSPPVFWKVAVSRYQKRAAAKHTRAATTELSLRPLTYAPIYNETQAMKRQMTQQKDKTGQNSPPTAHTAPQKDVQKKEDQ